MMEKLMKINARIKKKQIGRLIGAGICVFFGGVLWTGYSFQEGVTACQRAIAKFYPDVYASLTAKVLETVEQEGATRF